MSIWQWERIHHWYTHQHWSISKTCWVKKPHMKEAILLIPFYEIQGHAKLNYREVKTVVCLRGIDGKGCERGGEQLSHGVLTYLHVSSWAMWQGLSSLTWVLTQCTTVTHRARGHKQPRKEPPYPILWDTDTRPFLIHLPTFSWVQGFPSGPSSESTATAIQLLGCSLELAS